ARGFRLHQEESSRGLRVRKNASRPPPKPHRASSRHPRPPENCQPGDPLLASNRRDVESSGMVKLSVNVNKIAVLRNSRGGETPSVLKAARTAIAAGCHGITVHPRPDARHITRRDVLELAEMLTVEFNIEGYPSPEFLDLVCQVRPTQCTLVPDPPDVLTSNAGWNLKGDVDWLEDVLQQLHDNNIRSSLFLEPDTEQVR